MNLEPGQSIIYAGNPTPPKVVFTGTGRCGTKSVTVALQLAGLAAVHEPLPLLMELPIAAFVAGRWSEDEIMTAMGSWEWPQYPVGWWFTEVAYLLDCPVVWIRRNPVDVVNSMVSEGWYSQDSDYLPPTGVWNWMEPTRAVLSTNPPGTRPKGAVTGDFTAREWLDLPQRDRCVWWVGRVDKLLSPVADFVLDVDDPDLAGLSALVGREIPALPRIR